MNASRDPSCSYFLFEKSLNDLYLVYLEGLDDGAVLLEIEDIWADMCIEDRNAVGRMIERIHHGITYKHRREDGNYA